MAINVGSSGLSTDQTQAQLDQILMLLSGGAQAGMGHLPNVGFDDVGGLAAGTDYAAMMKPNMDDYWGYATGPEGAFGTAQESRVLGGVGRATETQLSQGQRDLLDQASTSGLSGQFTRRLGQELSRSATSGMLGTIQDQGMQRTMAGTEAYGAMQSGLAGATVQGSQDHLASIMNILNQKTEYAVGKVAAKGARSGGLLSGLGSIAGGFIAAGCWVAREVYGQRNPRWVIFRAWLMSDAPAWFRKLYITYGPRFAKFISDKPKVKRVIRWWMDRRINSYVRKRSGRLVQA